MRTGGSVPVPPPDISVTAIVVGSFAITATALMVSMTAAETSSALVVLSFVTFSCVLSAAQAQIYVYLPELFPTPLRGSGLGMAVAASRLGAAAGTSLLPWCVTHWGIQVALGVCVATLVFGGVTSYLFAPETRYAPLATD